MLANVYTNTGAWARVERWHPTCYEAAGSPHGRATGDVEHEHNPSRPGPYGRTARALRIPADKRPVLEGVTHGKDGTYQKGCRCEDCSAEHSRKMKLYTERRKAREAASA